MLRFILAFTTLLICLPATFSQEEEEEKTPLGEEMSAMNKSWRTLKRSVSDPAKNQQSLKLLASMRKAAVTSLDMVPIRSEEVSESDRPDFIEGYQKGMKETLVRFDDLKVALENGDNEKAAALVKKINDLRKSGHRDYKPEDED
tara:strand:- start:254 stop:688 length:435 start_codon:yes stop_codon:yes gene_type:complete